MGIYSEAPLTNDGRGVWLTVTQWGDAVFTGHGPEAAVGDGWKGLTLAILSGMFFCWPGTKIPPNGKLGKSSWKVPFKTGYSFFHEGNKTWKWWMMMSKLYYVLCIHGPRKLATFCCDIFGFRLVVQHIIQGIPVNMFLTHEYYRS